MSTTWVLTAEVVWFGGRALFEFDPFWRVAYLMLAGVAAWAATWEDS